MQNLSVSNCNLPTQIVILVTAAVKEHGYESMTRWGLAWWSQKRKEKELDITSLDVDGMRQSRINGGHWGRLITWMASWDVLSDEISVANVTVSHCERKRWVLLVFNLEDFVAPGARRGCIDSWGSVQQLEVEECRNRTILLVSNSELIRNYFDFAWPRTAIHLKPESRQHSYTGPQCRCLTDHPFSAHSDDSLVCSSLILLFHMPWSKL